MAYIFSPEVETYTVYNQNKARAALLDRLFFFVVEKASRFLFILVSFFPTFPLFAPRSDDSPSAARARPG